jgi:hypothetical protein
VKGLSHEEAIMWVVSMCSLGLVESWNSSESRVVDGRRGPPPALTGPLLDNGSKKDELPLLSFFPLAFNFLTLVHAWQFPLRHADKMRSLIHQRPTRHLSRCIVLDADLCSGTVSSAS